MTTSVMEHRIARLRPVEGRRVTVRLADGSRVDGELVSAGRRGLGTIWVFTAGVDAFFPLREVVDVTEPSRVAPMPRRYEELGEGR